MKTETFFIFSLPPCHYVLVWQATQSYHRWLLELKWRQLHPEAAKATAWLSSGKRDIFSLTPSNVSEAPMGLLGSAPVFEWALWGALGWLPSSLTQWGRIPLPFLCLLPPHSTHSLTPHPTLTGLTAGWWCWSTSWLHHPHWGAVPGLPTPRVL